MWFDLIPKPKSLLPMKLRFTFLAALAMTVAGTQLAQAQIGIGIQGGYLSSKARVENNSDDFDEVTDAVTGYTIGIPIEISLAKAVAVQAEVNYLRRGYTRQALNPNNNGIEFYNNVLEIPLLLKVGYIGDKFSLAGVAGPAFNYTTSSKLEGLPTGDIDIDFDSPDFDDINRSNFYGIVGAQLGVPIGIGKFVVDGRYRFQLNDEINTENLTVNGRGVSATAGLIFTLGDY